MMMPFRVLEYVVHIYKGQAREWRRRHSSFRRASVAACAAGRVQDAAILPSPGRPVPQRYREHRRARTGLGNDSGRIQRGDGGRGRRFRRLLSLFNMPGRFFWSSLSDYVGRKNVYAVCWAVIFSMYGGGFATIPAYLRDLFGTMPASSACLELAVGRGPPALGSVGNDGQIAESFSMKPFAPSVGLEKFS
jgi:hypothetical protein